MSYQQYPPPPQYANCPKCGKPTQWATSKKTGKPYQKCPDWQQCKWWAGDKSFTPGPQNGPMQQQQSGYQPGPPQPQYQQQQPYVPPQQPVYAAPGQYGADPYNQPAKRQAVDQHVGGDDYREPDNHPEPVPVVPAQPAIDYNKLILDLFKERLKKDDEILTELKSLRTYLEEKGNADKYRSSGLFGPTKDSKSEQ